VKKRLMRAAPIAQLKDDLMHLSTMWPSLNPDDYPYEELREIARKINDLTVESRNAALLRRDFFANASHELKTPVTAIKGSAELLRADVPLEESQQRELLQRIEAEAERLHNLINDIIMINRLESGEPAGEKEPVNLDEIVRACVDELRGKIQQNRLRVDLDLEAVSLLANRKNIYELLGNLIVNAVNYTPPGGRVEMHLRMGAQGVIFSIRNDGEPIPPGHQARMFERFYRLDAGRSKSVGGTGLGLAIVKHAVESHGGTIRLESDERVGVLFTVMLPI